MKSRIILILILIILRTANGFSQNTLDSLKEMINIHDGKITALDDRVLVNESDLAKLNKIKVSGYIQAQWELYQTDLVKKYDPMNTFYIRRARVKFTYEMPDGIKFVLQPDFTTGNLVLKDAYAVVNWPKVKDLTLWAGQFNRPDYEVEYSSSSREVLERSRLIRAIYPGEREVGAKLEYTPSQIPIKAQLAVLNGNFSSTQQKDIDNGKDIMPRLVYSLKMPDAGIGIDLGAHAYIGSVRAKQMYINSIDNQLDSVNAGDYLKKKWFGGEIQAYFDILGGMSLKGEYITGQNVSIPTTPSKTSPYSVKDFSGFYAYFIKNIGKKYQFIARYDVYDPNSKLSGDAAGTDIKYSTLTLAGQYYVNDFIRISLQYEMPKNETNVKYPTELKDNTFSVRIQAKF